MVGEGARFYNYIRHDFTQSGTVSV